MEKQKKQFLVVIAVLVVCVAAYFGVSSYAKKEQERKEQETADQQVTVAEIDVDQTDSFSYIADGETYHYQKDDKKWSCKEDTTLSLDAALISDMLGNLEKVEAAEKLEDYEKLSDYGLDSPRNTITVTCGDNSTIFNVGDYNEMLGEYYLQKEGDNSVYLIDSSLADTFSQLPMNLVEVEEE